MWQDSMSAGIDTPKTGSHGLAMDYLAWVSSLIRQEWGLYTMFLIVKTRTCFLGLGWTSDRRSIISSKMQEYSFLLITHSLASHQHSYISHIIMTWCMEHYTSLWCPAPHYDPPAPTIWPPIQPRMVAMPYEAIPEFVTEESSPRVQTNSQAWQVTEYWGWIEHHKWWQGHTQSEAGSDLK